MRNLLFASSIAKLEGRRFTAVRSNILPYRIILTNQSELLFPPPCLDLSFPCYDLVQHLGLSERRRRDLLRDTARLKPAHKNAALVWARLEAVPSRLKTPTHL